MNYYCYDTVETPLSSVGFGVALGRLLVRGISVISNATSHCPLV